MRSLWKGWNPQVENTCFLSLCAYSKSTQFSFKLVLWEFHAMHFDHSLTSPPTPNQAQVSPAQPPTKTAKLNPNLGIYYATLFPGRRDHCGSRIKIWRARDSGWLWENCSLDTRGQLHIWTHCQWCKACGPMQAEARRSIDSVSQCKDTVVCQDSAFSALPVIHLLPPDILQTKPLPSTFIAVHLHGWCGVTVERMGFLPYDDPHCGFSLYLLFSSLSWAMLCLTILFC